MAMHQNKKDIERVYVARVLMNISSLEPIFQKERVKINDFVYEIREVEEIPLVGRRCERLRWGHKDCDLEATSEDNFMGLDVSSSKSKNAEEDLELMS